MGDQWNISLDDDKLEVVDELGIDLKNDDCRKVEVEIRVIQGRKIGDAWKALVNGGSLSIESARSLLWGVLVPTRMYGCETQVYLGQDKSKIRAVEMDFIWSELHISVSLIFYASLPI